ncbi:DUF4113 domain-containing protein [Methylophilus sp. Leaf408]|uniref:DUF4113 domain-containing protein n=1 Tax=Methylophilus sp. Leaf408 TaxID=2876561 RepID=UPI001E2B2ED9|nr:DUF4113 domain-containing protein [Methylophilus sp. Leaf408]
MLPTQLLDRQVKRLCRSVHPGQFTVPSDGLQTDLFGYSDRDEKSGLFGAGRGKINNKYSRGTIWLASEGIEGIKDWAMQRNFKSPNYTGDWGDLLGVR